MVFPLGIQRASTGTPVSMQKMNEGQAKEQRTYEDGALVFVSIGKKTWTTVQTPQMYGLEKWPKLNKPGRVLLLPEEALKKIDHLEDQARGVADAFRFDYGIEEGRSKLRWIHISKLGLVMTALDEIKEQFFAAVDELIANYEVYKEEIQATMAVEFATMKTQLNNPDLKDPWPDLSSQYIDVKAIRKHYYFTVKPVQMTAVKQFEVTQADLAVLHRKRAEELTEAEMAHMRSQHAARLDRVLSETQAEAAKRADAFVEGVVTQLRGKVVEVFKGITDKIAEGKPLIASNLNRIRETLQEVRQMDFIRDDAAFHQQLASVEALINSGREFKDDKSATAELNRMLGDTVSFISSTNQSAIDGAKKTYFGRRLNI